MEKQKILFQLKTYCERESEILFGFLFGSLAAELTSQESDIDIAIYLKKEGSKLENKIQADLESILKKEVDLIILNRCPATIAWTALRKGIPLTIEDRGLYLDFMLEVSSEAEDFIDFNLDTYRRKNALGKAG